MDRAAVTTCLLLALAGVFAGGCGAGSSRWDGPARPAPVRVEAWSFEGQPGRKLVTPNYAIYTTVQDLDVVEAVGQLVEGALAQYRRLSPPVPAAERSATVAAHRSDLSARPLSIAPSHGPLECYLFQTREQWASFTRSRTGADAAVYLQINRGGYTVRDWYVAFFIGDVGTYSVIAHEGWHQYVARHFKSRLPPFLEEGLACMFEEVRWGGRSGRLPRWSLSRNGSRLVGLREALEGGRLVPLAELAEMHAGHVVDRPTEEIDAFYAQSWAFVRFLWEADDGQYRPILRRMLADATAGTLFPGDPVLRRNDGTWDAGFARPMLEYYLSSNLDDMDVKFRRYVHALVARNFRATTE